MKVIRFFIISALTLFCSLAAHAQGGDGLRERIYVATDKEAYIAGEMLWFSAFTTDEKGVPIDFSKVAYIELLDGNAPKEQASFDLEGGKGNGCIVLSNTLPTGYYKLVAYTRNMRNESPVPVFGKLIAIANVNSVMTAEVAADDNMPVPDGKPTPIDTGIRLSVDKSYYARREKVALRIEGLPEEVHSLSVAVAGVPYITTGNTDITTWDAALKATTPGTLSRNFIPEAEGPIITGQLIDQQIGAPATPADGLNPYISFASGDVKFFGGYTDLAGQVSFFTRRVTGLNGLVSSVTGEGGNRFRVDIEQPYIPHTEHKYDAMPHLNALRTDTTALLKQSMAMQVAYAYANDSLQRFSGTPAPFMRQPDNVYKMEEYAKFPTMQEVVTEILSPLRFRMIDDRRYLFLTRRQAEGFPLKNTLVMLDGIPIFDHQIIYDYSPILLDRVEIYGDRYIIGGENFEGIVVFRTPGNNYPEMTPDKSTYFFEYKAPMLPRIFYAPQHADGTNGDRTPDFRHTLHWESMLQTNGKAAAEVAFFTSDLPGTYTAVAEGIAKDGQPLRATVSFTVE